MAAFGARCIEPKKKIHLAPGALNAQGVEVRGVGRPGVGGYERGSVGRQEGLGGLRAVSGSRVLYPDPLLVAEREGGPIQHLAR